MMSSASDAMAAERVQSQELLKELSQVPGDHLSPDPGIFNLLPQEKMPLDEEGNDLPTDQIKISVLQEAANLFRSSQGGEGSPGPGTGCKYRGTRTINCGTKVLRHNSQFTKVPR